MQPLLDNLNAAQRDAVLHVDGALLILAGPGSGKTRVVTHRVAHLLASGVHASQILALTFTNKAATEMRSRVAKLAPGERVWVSTFHRFGARLLRQYAEQVGLQPNYTIYDASDSRHTLKRVIESEKINTLHYTVDRIAAAISSAKNKLVGPAEIEAKAHSPLSRVVAEVYPAYQQRLLASSAVDFDDLLLHIARLLHDQEEVRQQLDERFRYVMVDEYQDTNRAQYVILRALSHDYPNLAATGDPDQSIYGWRGADLNNILQFERDYPNVRVVRLEQNYRSTKAVLRVADSLIRHNKRRKPKELFTANDEGQQVKLVTYADQDDEANSIARHIAAAVDSGARVASEFAIFYRVNALSRSIERALRAHQIPFQMVRGQEFYQRKEIRDVLAYCQQINNPLDDVALQRTINTPARGIGKKTIERISDYAIHHGLAMLDAAREVVQIEGLAKRAITAVTKYVTIVDKIVRYAGQPVEEVIGAVLSESGYREHLASSDDEEDHNRLANIEELLTDARQFDDEYDPLEFSGETALEDYLERTWLVNETDNWDDETDKVTMMTLHAAKGLEFPVVFLVAVEDGVLPHERSLEDPSQLEEERRLAFVGITRAEQELQLSHVLRRDFRGRRSMAIPSSFLMEIGRDELDTHHAATQESLLDNAIDELYEEPVFEQLTPISDDSCQVEQSTVTTAAAMAGEARGVERPLDDERVPPDRFRLGMTVLHPEYGLGKIVTLSGSGNSRKARVQFVLGDERPFMLAHSPLRPVNARSAEGHGG